MPDRMTHNPAEFADGTSIRPNPASFRDPSGYVYEEKGKVIRAIEASFAPHWEYMESMGFLSGMAEQGLVPRFARREPRSDAWAEVTVDRIPFISYPYEWCFSQLKDAALLTLQLQRTALEQGLELKDASAYNVQFVGGSPVFIDLLSFERREEGTPWPAYRQFCSHFLAPLALARYRDLRCGALSRLWIDGVPLDLTQRLLPWRTFAHWGLLWHIGIHAAMQAKHGDTRASAAKAKAVRVSREVLLALTGSLEKTVRGMHSPHTTTEWADYYADTNYTDTAMQHKAAVLDAMAREYATPGMALDLGANNGFFSRILGKRFGYVLAADIDPLATERHYLTLRGNKGNILPLIHDVANPAPGLGFAGTERKGFAERCRVDFMAALAVIHHLVISAGIPLRLLAAHFGDMVRPGGALVVEFVPKEDSQTQRLLAVRSDIFDDYSLEGCIRAFAPHFSLQREVPVQESRRTILLFRRR